MDTADTVTVAKEQSHLPRQRQQLPRRECDIVMKGGVTSGIVYPPALLKLKDTYIFNSIGGTSAGAVAAAAVAAAEYARQSGGFDRFRDATDDFTDNLIGRFGAPKPTRPLFEMMKAVGSFGAADGTKLSIAQLLPGEPLAR